MTYMATLRRLILAHLKLAAAGLLMVAWLGYLLGLEGLFIIVVLGVVTTFLPMPRVFSSMASKALMAVFFLYALLQLAAMAQLYTYPSGKFAYIALLVAIVTGLLVFAFGRVPHNRVPAVSLKDVGVVVGCLLFVLPFVPIIRGDNAVDRIAQYGGIQVIDAVVHYGSTATYTDVQSLRQDYTLGRYYPSGFHIATGFIEHSVVGNVRNQGWKTNTIVYFSQYLLLGLLLGAVLIYFGYAVFEALGKQLDVTSIAAVALSVGLAGTILFLWEFIDLGFLNYFYVAAAVLMSATYLLDQRWEYNPAKALRGNRETYLWPAFAFLFVSFGASFSWPLLAPVFLLTAGYGLVVSLTLPVACRNVRTLVVLSLPLAAIGLLHVATVYIQTRYEANNSALVLLGGALQNFNILILVVGVGVTAVLVAKNLNQTAERLLILVVPFAILVFGLMVLHYFNLGEARYYVIKCALLLDMLFLGFGAAGLAIAVRSLRLHHLVRLSTVVVGVLFVVVVTMGSVPQPFEEIRSLFRQQSGAGLPPFYESDTAIITSLGASDKLQNYNMTILHYDASGNRLFAHIEPALWANTMAPYALDNVPQTTGTQPRATCFGQQLNLLAYGTNQTGEQGSIRRWVSECIASAAHSGAAYYIVTDPASVPTLREMFGSTPVLVAAPV